MKFTAVKLLTFGLIIMSVAHNSLADNCGIDSCPGGFIVTQTFYHSGFDKVSSLPNINAGVGPQDVSIMGNFLNQNSCPVTPAPGSPEAIATSKFTNWNQVQGSGVGGLSSLQPEAITMEEYISYKDQAVSQGKNLKTVLQRTKESKIASLSVLTKVLSEMPSDYLITLTDYLKQLAVLQGLPFPANFSTLTPALKAEVVTVILLKWDVLEDLDAKVTTDLTNLDKNLSSKYYIKETIYNFTARINDILRMGMTFNDLDKIAKAGRD